MHGLHAPNDKAGIGRLTESSNISPVKITVDFWTIQRYPRTLIETGIGGGIFMELVYLN